MAKSCDCCNVRIAAVQRHLDVMDVWWIDEDRWSDSCWYNLDVQYAQKECISISCMGSFFKLAAIKRVNWRTDGSPKVVKVAQRCKIEANSDVRAHDANGEVNTIEPKVREGWLLSSKERNKTGDASAWWMCSSMVMLEVQKVTTSQSRRMGKRVSRWGR